MITRAPEIVLPATAHASFQTACLYLDVRPVVVLVDPRTFRADVDVIRRASTPETVLLHRSKELRRHQMYTCANWTGYRIVNPTAQSTNSAGPVAAAWAVLHPIGTTAISRSRAGSWTRPVASPPASAPFPDSASWASPT